MIALEVTKKQGFTLSLEDTFLRKPQGRQIDPPSLLRVKKNYLFKHHDLFPDSIENVLTRVTLGKGFAFYKVFYAKFSF